MKNFYNLTILSITLAVILQWPQQSIAGDTLTSVTNFDDFLKVFNRISKPAEKVRFTEAVWGEIRADYPDDLNKATSLYNRFSSVLGTMELPEQIQAAAELVQEIRRHLISKNAHLLANTWNGDQFPNTDAIRKFCRGLIKNYELDMVKDIYNRAIDEIYPLRSTEILAGFLYDLVDADQPSSFEVMVSAELYLYWKFVNNDGVNDDYLFNLGIYLRQITNDKKYAKLTMEDQRRVRKVIGNLPVSLHNFLFESNFCLINKNQSQVAFSYDSYNINAASRFLFVYYSANTWPYGAQQGWNMDINTQDLSALNGTVDVTFTLKGNTTSMDLYLERNVVDYRDIVALNRFPNVEPKNSEWRVKLIENQLAFYQNEFIMCVDHNIYDAYRILVQGFNDYYHTASYAPCQWTVGFC